MTTTNELAYRRALKPLGEVTKKLIRGVNKAEFEREYRGKFITPGVQVWKYVRELRLNGDLIETDTTMKLKPDK